MFDVGGDVHWAPENAKKEGDAVADFETKRDVLSRFSNKSNLK